MKIRIYILILIIIPKVSLGSSKEEVPPAREEERTTSSAVLPILPEARKAVERLNAHLA